MATTTITPDQTRSTEVELRFDEDVNRYVVSDYLGSFQEAHVEPQAFLVEFQNAFGAIRPHYHEVDQYQVVVGGSGSIGKHALEPGAIHYADCYSPYGPIKSGPEGITFFTLRTTGVRGSNYMPESRDRKPVRSGHQFECQADLSLPVNASACRLLGTSPDGAEAHELRAAPATALPSPGAEALANPGYYVVLAGELQHDGRVLPTRSCVYHAEGDAHLDARVGPEGTVVAYLSFRRTGIPEVSPQA